MGAVVAVIALGADGEEAPAPRPEATVAQRPPAGRFDGARAFAELERQVELGPRPAGSKALRGLAGRLRRALPNGRFEPVPGHPGLRNVVGHLPGSKPAVAIAAHYDTKDLPGFVGANDGAGGTAAVLELARALAQVDRLPGAPALRFILFDGEEATDDSRAFERTGHPRLEGVCARARRRAARADPARLRGGHRHADGARVLVRPAAVAEAARRGEGGRRASGTSRRGRAARSPTTTRRS